MRQAEREELTILGKSENSSTKLKSSSRESSRPVLSNQELSTNRPLRSDRRGQANVLAHESPLRNHLTAARLLPSHSKRRPRSQTPSKEHSPRKDSRKCRSTCISHRRSRLTLRRSSLQRKRMVSQICTLLSASSTKQWSQCPNLSPDLNGSHPLSLSLTLSLSTVFSLVTAILESKTEQLRTKRSLHNRHSCSRDSSIRLRPLRASRENPRLSHLFPQLSAAATTPLAGHFQSTRKVVVEVSFQLLENRLRRLEAVRELRRRETVREERSFSI